MSPRHFTKAIYGPYYLSDKHYNQPKKPQTKFEVFTYKMFKYTGINSIIKFVTVLRTPVKMEFEAMPYQTRPEAEEVQSVDLKALRESRRAAKQSDQ